MKLFSFSRLSFLGLALFFFGCASHHTSRNTAPITSHLTAVEVVDPTMVNVVSASRMPSLASAINVDLPNDPVSVSVSIVQLPGDAVGHATMLFTVKKSPDVAGQIAGNTEGSEASKKFVRVVQRMIADGVNAPAAAAIVAAQNRIKNIPNLPAEERMDAIKSALYEARDKLLTAY